MEHIFLVHRIHAPAGEKTKSAAERKAEAQAASDGSGGSHRSISQHFGLDTTKPREQAIANSLVKPRSLASVDRSVDCQYQQGFH